MIAQQCGCSVRGNETGTGTNAPEKLYLTESPALVVVWYVVSSEDNEESFWNDHWPVNGRAVSSITVLEKVTLDGEKSVPGTPGARRVMSSRDELG